MAYKMGIDLGGTKTEVLVLDSAQQPVYRERFATPAQDYDEILSMIETQVNAMQSRFGIGLTLGIGIPGAISPQTGLLRNSNTVCMNGRAFLRDVESRLGREVRIENDANCFALSEALGGAGQGYRVVFGIIIGTGTGGGLVVDGKLLNGPHSITGEWGHNPLPWCEDDGKPDCYCGKQACIETFLSGPGLARNYQRRFGESCDSSGIVAAAARGDQSCIDMLDSYHDQMARSLAQLINILDPDAIVLGGGMSNIDTIYTRGDSSGVYGAAFLWE
jgi:fructokinase